MALLSCENLTLGYDGREIVRDLSFSVERGDYLCIVGENGSGKTTLMKALLGLTEPLSGRVKIGDGLRRNRIGYLPQQTEVQKDFPATVWEIVLSGCCGSMGLNPFYSAAQKEKARANLQKMGLSDLARRCYRELSGGQQQRVLLARALCAAEEVLLLDEPVTGLDPKVTGELYDLIARLNREDHLTILMISHDVAAAMRYADHVLHVGKTVFFGTTDEYRTSRSAALFLKGGEAK